MNIDNLFFIRWGKYLFFIRWGKYLEAGGVDDGLALCAALGDTLDLLIAELALPSVSDQPLTDRLVHRCPNAKILRMCAWPFDSVEQKQGLLPGERAITKALQCPETPEHGGNRSALAGDGSRHSEGRLVSDCAKITVAVQNVGRGVATPFWTGGSSTNDVGFGVYDDG